jgi:hypothetical protein
MEWSQSPVQDRNAGCVDRNRARAGGSASRWGAERLRPRTEISIRDLHQNPSLRRKSVNQILGDRIDDEDGHRSTPWDPKRNEFYDSCLTARSNASRKNGMIVRRSSAVRTRVTCETRLSPCAILMKHGATALRPR